MVTSSLARTRRFRPLAPWLVCLLGLFIYHRYSILSGLDQVQADNGDSRFIAFLLEHWNAVAEGKAHWRSPLIFYPLRGVLGYSDALFGMGALHVFLRHLGLGVFAAVNAQLVLLSGLAFAACYSFLRRGFGLATEACCVGAYYFAFGWPRYAQLVHEQLQFTFPLPLLALLALRILRDGLTITKAEGLILSAGFALLFALLISTTTYYALFFALALTLTVGLCLARTSSRRHIVAVLRRHAWSLAGGGLLLAAFAAPIIDVYRPVARLSGGRAWPEVTQFLVHPSDMEWMGRENFIWGWLFGHFPLRADRNWPEMRIGSGVVVGLAWGAATMWAIGAISGVRAAFLNPVLGSRASSAALILVVSAILQLSILCWPLNLSLWWLFYTSFPGLSGVRAVSRLELLIMLSIALALALVTQRLWACERRRRWVRSLLVCALAFGALEQAGTGYAYSGSQAERIARRVAVAVPAQCPAFYVVAPPGLLPPPPVVTTQAAFDAKAYLAANPDVAANWTGPAWDHYVKFGRAEHRYLDPEAGRRYRSTLFFYAYTVPLAATLSGKPAVNGLSGWTPPGYDLGDALATDAPVRLDRWMLNNGLPQGSVCTVEVPLDPADLPQRNDRLW